MELIKLPPAISDALRDAGIDSAAILHRAGLPSDLWITEGLLVSPAQALRFWTVLGESVPDPAFALKLTRTIPTEKSHPACIAALHSRNFREGLARFARYKRLSCGDEVIVEERRGECRISFEWPETHEPIPLLLIDIVFSSAFELGRRGTRSDLRPLRVDLAALPLPGGAHEAHYGCPVRWSARRNVLLFRSADLDLPFVTSNIELLSILGPKLDEELARRKESRTISERVKLVVARSLEKGRLELTEIARELGIGSRTLQRRISGEGTTFRRLIDETRREMARHYLNQPSLTLGEAAFLLGYEDPNSFFRAFNRWEGSSPAAWRASHGA